MDCDKCDGFGTYKEWDEDSYSCSCCYDNYRTVWCDCPRTDEIRALYEEGEERERQIQERRQAEREAERLRRADEDAKRIRARWAERRRLLARTPVEIQEELVRDLESQLADARAKLEDLRGN